MSQEIDLRNNSISGEGEAEGAAALLARVGALRMSGNPLRCTCADGLLQLLRAPQVLDFAALRCAGGRRLAEAAAQCAGARGWLWALAALGAGAVLLGAVALALRRAVRLRLKTFLLARGLCLRWINFDDDDCMYAYRS